MILFLIRLFPSKMVHFVLDLLIVKMKLDINYQIFQQLTSQILLILNLKDQINLI